MKASLIRQPSPAVQTITCKTLSFPELVRVSQSACRQPQTEHSGGWLWAAGTVIREAWKGRAGAELLKLLHMGGEEQGRTSAAACHSSGWGTMSNCAA